jgi:DNA invertase Pin-like site-specific DNA recombinase
MSEAELHLIHLRLQGGRKRKIESGEYRQSLPTGLIRQPDGTVVKDPDAQIRHALELLFAKFEELGSCGKVMRYLRDASMLLPRLQTTGPHRGEVLWKQPSRIAIHAILRNPAYAGTFVHGRSQTDPTRQKPGHPYSGIVRKPMEDWVHIHQGIYPAYITWEQYMANQKQLQQNSTRFQENIQCAQGASRRGSALLQGLARCGHCGHRLKVGYKPVPRYHCDTLASEVGGPICTSFHGTVVDEVVSRAFLDALQPAHIDALEAILTEQQTEHKRLSQQWRERLKRAEYEAHLAQRQYNAVDPDNRLVAAELERRWEMKLRQLQKTREEYDRFQHTTRPSALPPKLREQFRNISDTLPGLWESGQISNEQKKRLLRCLISRVILKNERPGTIEIKIVWVSGYYSIIYAYPPIHATRDLDGYDRMIDRIQELWQEGRTDQQIAIQLTSEGFRSARSTDVIPSLVQRIRLEHSWRSRLPTSCRTLKIEGYITVKELASRLGVNRQWISRRIRNKQIDPKYITQHSECAAYFIRDDPELVRQLQQETTRRTRDNGGI